jgi:hypothetical protein
MTVKLDSSRKGLTQAPNNLQPPARAAVPSTQGSPRSQGQDGFDTAPPASQALPTTPEASAAVPRPSLSVSQLMGFVGSQAPLAWATNATETLHQVNVEGMPAQSVGTATGGSQVASTDIPPATGVDDDFLGAVPESPEAAVARITDPNNETYQSNPDQRARDMVWLAAHHPEFLPQVYEALGPEESARLLEQTVDYGVYGDNHQVFGNSETSASILNTLGASFAAMPPDFQAKAGTYAAQEGLWDLSLIFRQPAGSAAAPGALDPARAAFAEALHPQALTDPEAARAVGNALAGSQALVNQYAAPTEAGGWGNDFITMLNVGLSEADYTQATWNSDQSSLQDAGLAQVVGMVGHYDGPDADFIKANVFKTAAYALERSGGDNPALVSGMEQLFLSDSRAITEWLASGTRPDDPTNQVPNAAEDPTGAALGIFFQKAVFENPEPEGAVVMEMNRLMSEYKGEMSSNDPAVYDHAGRHIGYLLGAMGAGYEDAVADNKDSQAAREALVNMAWGAIKGPVTGAAGSAAGPAGSFLAGQGLDASQQWIQDFINGDLDADLESMDQIFTRFVTEALRGLPDEKKTAMLAWFAGISEVNEAR